MNTYCISCKKDTECIKREIVKTKNNRLIFRSVCTVCKKNKSRFCKGLKESDSESFKPLGSSTDIHGKILSLLPKKELTLPSYNYCDPGNPLNNGKPVNELDAICKRHDYC